MAPVALKRVDATTVEATYMRGLQVTASSRRVLSEDVQVMIISTVWRGADGESHTNVAVFERSTSLAVTQAKRIAALRTDSRP